MTASPTACAVPALIQMSGIPGAGKSTIARSLGDRLHALVIDHDVLKSGLMSAGMPSGHGEPFLDPEDFARSNGYGAGEAAYDLAFGIADRLLAARLSVILDSPCYYDRLLRDGQRLAAANGARYVYVECVNQDLEEIARRLSSRPRLPSQMQSSEIGPASARHHDGLGANLLRSWAEGMKRPRANALLVETSAPVDEVVPRIAEYVEGVTLSRA